MTDVRLGMRFAPYAAGFVSLVHRLAAEIAVAVNAAVARHMAVHRRGTAAGAQAGGRCRRCRGLCAEPELGGRGATGLGAAAGPDDPARAARSHRAGAAADRRCRLGKSGCRATHQPSRRYGGHRKSTAHILLLIH